MGTSQLLQGSQRDPRTFNEGCDSLQWQGWWAWITWYLQTFLVILGFLCSFGEGCGTLHFQEPSPEFLLKIKEHFWQRGSLTPLPFLLKVTKLITLPGQFSQHYSDLWLLDNFCHP